MGHYRNAALGQKADGFGHAAAAFQFDGTTFGFLHHAGGVAEGLGRAFLIGTEGHVHHHKRAARATGDGAAMHDHEVEGHGDCRFKAVHDHAEAVAHEQEIHIFIGNGGGVRVIGGERHNGCRTFARGDVRCGYAPLRR